MKLKITAFWLVILAALFIFLQEYSLLNKASCFSLPVIISAVNWLCRADLR